MQQRRCLSCTERLPGRFRTRRGFSRQPENVSFEPPEVNKDRQAPRDYALPVSRAKILKLVQWKEQLSLEAVNMTSFQFNGSGEVHLYPKV